MKGKKANLKYFFYETNCGAHTKSNEKVANYPCNYKYNRKILAARSDVRLLLLYITIINTISTTYAADCPEHEIVKIHGLNVSIVKNEASTYYSQDNHKVSISIDRELLSAQTSRSDALKLLNVSNNYKMCFFSVFIGNNRLASGRVANVFFPLSIEQYMKYFTLLLDSSNKSRDLTKKYSDHPSVEMNLIISKEYKND